MLTIASHLSIALIAAWRSRAVGASHKAVFDAYWLRACSLLFWSTASMQLDKHSSHNYCLDSAKQKIMKLNRQFAHIWQVLGLVARPHQAPQALLHPSQSEPTPQGPRGLSSDPPPLVQVKCTSGTFHRACSATPAVLAATASVLVVNDCVMILHSRHARLPAH